MRGLFKVRKHGAVLHVIKVAIGFDIKQPIVSSFEDEGQAIDTFAGIK